MRKGEWSSWKAAEKVEVTGEEMLLLSNWINKMMEMKGRCGTVKKMNQSWCLTTGFAPGLFKKCCCFFFFTLTVTHLSFSLNNSWRCLFPCVSNKETIWEKWTWKQVRSHTHKKPPLQLDYTSSKNRRTTTRPTSQAPFDLPLSVPYNTVQTAT